MWQLDYDGALLMRIPEDSTNPFSSGIFYKLKLRRYVREVLPGFVRFKPVLTYLDYKKVRELCAQEAKKQGIPFETTPALEAYIASRELHLEIRSRLGIELKAKDEKLSDRFTEYQSVVDNQMARKLRLQQAWDSFFMCSMQKSANFSVPGSGKTASVLGMYAYLRSKGLVKRLLVICPKNAFGSWMDEFRVCFAGIEPLRVFNIHNPAYKNTKQRKAALELDSGNCNLILVNYESVSGVLEILDSIVSKDTLLVFDEVHKVKRINGEYAEHAVRLAREASYAVAMTGTPIPNSYIDIYNLLHILFPNEYEEFFGFSVNTLRSPTASDVTEINDKLQPFFCRTNKNQLGVPPAEPDEIIPIKAGEAENRLLKILSMKYKKNKLALLIRILQLETNPAMLLENVSLQDFAYLLDDGADTDEIDYADYSQEVKQLIESVKYPTKFLRCLDHVESITNQGKPVIVWCMFVNSITRLAQELTNRGIRCCCVYGEVPLEERQELLNKFRSGEIQVLLTNPHTLAESVSLHSVCHDAVYYEYSYNLVHLLQSKDRIHRLGLPEGQYTRYSYMQVHYETVDGLWSMEQAVYDRLKEKEEIMLRAIDHQVLETLPTTAEDLDTIFSGLKL